MKTIRSSGVAKTCRSRERCGCVRKTPCGAAGEGVRSSPDVMSVFFLGLVLGVTFGLVLLYTSFIVAHVVPVPACVSPCCLDTSLLVRFYKTE